MSRRVRTLLIGGVLFLVLVVVAFTLPVPYVILSPGPTINTLGKYDNSEIIMISNGKTASSTSGHLNLTTVSITTGRINMWQALSGWLAHDEVVVPRETIYPPGQSQEEVNQQDKADFTDSQVSAEAAAFCLLDYPKYFGVAGVTTDLTPSGSLKIGDKLISLNGAAIGDQASLEKVLAAQTAGTEAAVVVERRGTETTVSVKLQPPATGKTGARIGIVISNACFAPFDVSLGLNNDIGGPSAGMMFALGIIEKLGRDLTGGRFVAGTGTIDNDGNVGAIGGIQLKMIAARRAGATLFLAPASNCTDVRGNIPKGLTVAKVAKLTDAITALDAVKVGKTVPGC
ncbi:MAG: Endopeptidase La [Pseudonocardiales bacterium]|nr:Endopeptidase La [Pseudonocardiales bacterium]